MATNVSEFPCIEAARCLVGEKEIGQRLTIKAAPGDEEADFVTTFTTGQSSTEEWYMHLKIDEGNEDAPEGMRHVLQLRHSETHQYLSCEEKGRVKCVSQPLDTTWWWVQRVDAHNPPDESTVDQYILISKKFPNRRLSYAKSFDDAGDEYMLITSKSNALKKSVWTLKFTSGELCFIKNPVVHLQMRCNLIGSLSLTSQSNGWEVFRFIEVGNGDVLISSWLHLKKFVTSDADGHVTTTDGELTSLGFSERWRLEIPKMGNGVYLRNVASRRYLSIGRTRNEHFWTTTKPNDYALWHLNHPHSHIYYVASLFASNFVQSYSKEGSDDVYVSSSKEGPFLVMKSEKEEEWKVELTPEGFFTFFSVSHEKYLGCNSTGVVHTTTSKGAWTLWKKEVSSKGGVMFLSKEHLRYLAVDNESKFLCTTAIEEGTDLRNSFRMDPRLPRIVSGGTTGRIAGVMGLNLAVASPFAILGAMEASEVFLLNYSNVSVRSEVSDESNLVPKRPVSAWKFWVKGETDSLPSPELPSSSSRKPAKVTKTKSGRPKEVKVKRKKAAKPLKKRNSKKEDSKDNEKEPDAEKDDSKYDKKESNSEKEVHEQKQEVVAEKEDTNDDKKEPNPEEDDSKDDEKRPEAEKEDSNYEEESNAEEELHEKKQEVEAETETEDTNDEKKQPDAEKKDSSDEKDELNDDEEVSNGKKYESNKE